jgi:hypothetical protein
MEEKGDEHQVCSIENEQRWKKSDVGEGQGKV